LRTLSDIVENCKSGGLPDYEELRYALLVYEFMFNMDHRTLREELLSEKRSPLAIRELRANNSFNMFKKALNKSPKEYLGWNSDPGNPEYQKQRAVAERIFDKVMSKIKNQVIRRQHT
jgi:hypothetical protein